VPGASKASGYAATSMRLRFFPGRPIVVSLVAMTLLACGITSKRDMSVPPKELTFNDACSLQEYFDQRAAAALTSPQAADEMLATNEKGQTIGEGTYVLKDPLARRRFARLLREEYSGVDRKIIQGAEVADGRVTVHLRWWDAGPVRRVRPENDIFVSTPNGEVELPPNPCVSDLIFGEKVYAMRARYLRNEVDLATDKSGTPVPEPTIAPPPAPTTTAPPPAPSVSAMPTPSASASVSPPK
jgi:hypothetical protein